MDSKAKNIKQATDYGCYPYMNPSFVRDRRIVFYDNHCLLCHWSVRFILDHDKKGLFAFAPLQGETWQHLTKSLATPVTMEAVQYFDGKTLVDKSDAVLNIFQQMGSGWRLLTIFRMIPRAWRNAVYDFIARNRFRWFRRQIECSLEKQLPASRILD